MYLSLCGTTYYYSKIKIKLYVKIGKRQMKLKNWKKIKENSIF